MNMKTNITILVVALLLGACTSNDEERVVAPVSIQLTASVATETLSPGDATAWSREAWKELTSRRATRGVQDNSLASGQKAYLWADKGSAGTYTYLKAWALTSNGSGGLTGSTKYYPSDGDGLTFRAMHGNFSTTPTEGSTAIGTFTHSVLANQSASGNLELSDLMYGEGSGSYQTVSSAPLNFTHKLSKIEVKLTAGPGMGASDMPNVVVKVKNVKPSITINAADGSLGSASGTAITVTARHTGNGIFEAVIPPQTAPTGVLTLTYSGVTVTVPNTVATFASNRRYVYNVTVKNVCKEMNPLYYVAEGNVRSYDSSTKTVALETNPATAGYAYCFTWAWAMTYFAKQTSSYNEYWQGVVTDGRSSFRYHLPCLKELYSVLPVRSMNIFDNSSFLPNGGFINPAVICIFGYNDETKAGIDDWSYWCPFITNNVRYAIRFLGTKYCSAWKYEYSTNNHTLTVTAKLIPRLERSDNTLPAQLSAYINNASFWTTFNEDNGEFRRIFYSVGYRNGSNGIADRDLDYAGYCWSTTESGDASSFRLGFTEPFTFIDQYYKVYGFSVRLFHDR